MCWTASPGSSPRGSSASIAPGAETVAAAFAPHPTAVQQQGRCGTGDAAKAALPALEGMPGRCWWSMAIRRC